MFLHLSPLLARMGGRDIKRNSAKLRLMERTLWWINWTTTPSAPAEDATRLFLTGRSRPSWPGGVIVCVAVIASLFGCAAGSTESKDKPASAIPRTADGKPDLTGVYQGGSSRRGAWDFQVPGDQPGVATPETQSVFPAAQVRKDPIPFQPWAKEKAQEHANLRSIDDPAGRCLPGPGPRLNAVGLFPIQIVQTPEQIIILYEYFTVFRVIPLNAKHPEDLEPSFMGNSVGHWDGDTLVVDVVGFNDKGWVLAGGIFHSDALHITERYTRVDKDTINYEATIDDPKVFTKPFTSSTTLMLREGARLREFICPENNEDTARYEKLLERPELFRRTPPAPQ